MTTPARLFAAIILLGLLAACGNKGPLIKPSQIPPEPASAPSLPLPPPLEPATQPEAATPASDEPAPVTPAAEDGADSSD